ncbi:hypothetical protein CGCF413_v009996 [Colletotrichum fructicola]|nr:hypothetical protein CGCF413_v009996 [Colletotrichum fructicola]
MADTEAKGPKKVRIEEPFAKQTEPDVTDNTHNNVHWVTDDTGDADADSQSYTYATTNSSDASNLFDEVEERGLSVTLPLEPRDVQATIQLPPRSVFDAWKGPKTTIAEMSAEVQMFTIHSVEFSVGHSQREKVSITCNDGPMVGESLQPTSKLCRCLHIEKSSLSLGVLEKFITSCPFISPELQQVANKLLSDIGRNLTTTTDRGHRVEAGTIIRYLGILPHVANTKRGETEPVIFASCPHLVLEGNKPFSDGDGQAPQTLLHHLYGHGSESSLASDQVVQKLSIASPKEVINVNQLWCLLIGSGCLITYSPKAASELQEGLIHQVSSKPPQQGFLKMIFIHDNNERVSTEVGQDWTYVDLMQHAVSLIKQTRWAAGDFHLEDAQGERLYAKSWLELATSGSTDLGIIYIRKSKPGDPVTPVSCRTTPRRVSVTKMITYKPLDESQPSEANFLPDGSRTFGRLEDPANQSEDEKPTRRGTTGVGPETESNSIDFGENDDSRENESPPGNIPIEEDTQYVAEPVEEKALSLNDENINMESVETNGSIHHEPRNLQPKINPASSVKENDPDSGSTFSVENAYTDEFQDDPSNLYIRNIDSSTTSEKYLVPITRPFLEWRTQGVKINRSSEEIIKNTGSILDKLHADMIEGLNKDIYSVAFRCTPEDLWARSSINLPYKQSGFEQVSNIAGDVPKTLGSNAESEDQAENPTTTADNTEGTTDHDVLGCIWGSLDKIYRHLHWESLHGQEYWTDHYIVRNFDPLTAHSKSTPRTISGLSLSWSQCERCSKQERYPMLESALDHLHRVHFLCEAKQPVQHLSDDPCYVWILHVAKVQHGQMPQTLLSLTKTFVADLLDLNRRVKELHALVARPGKLADADKIIPPQLPTNLMLALDGIVTVHIMHSNQLSLMNQLEYINADPTREIPRDVKSKVEKSIKTMEARRIAAWTLTRNLFESSQRDIMRLKHTTREDDNAAVETVGVEFLALALMSNAQKRPILSEPIINIEDIYRIQMSRMRSEAVRRPKRRLFLELSALQEELDAVDGIVEAQQKLLANYLDLLSPDSFRKENETRARLHTAETRVAKRHKRMLDERHETLHSLQERATAFREQVKQTIEVLEEDHGKAIRVFTIVTLFFLPMSFISSFLGMNTTDIRDTEFDQRFFWIVSIPVTAVVVVLAMTHLQLDRPIHAVLSYVSAKSDTAHTRLAE